MTTILTDQDLSGGDIMPIAIEAVEAAMRKKALGELVAPPRHHVAFPGKGDLVFTVGGLVGDDAIAGFRVYDTFAGNEHSQIVAVWSADTARLEGLVLGEKLGAIRTGAIGGVAIRHLSSEDARTVGIIGSGLQARTQLAAAAAVRRLSHVRVFSRDKANRHAFATEMQRQLDIDIQPVETVEDAVADADIVICATSSKTPVIHARSLKPGVLLVATGPARNGIDAEILEALFRQNGLGGIEDGLLGGGAILDALFRFYVRNHLCGGARKHSVYPSFPEA